MTKPGDFGFVFNPNLLFWRSGENMSETNITINNAKVSSTS